MSGFSAFKARSKRRQSGFTLLDLCVALIIVGLVGAGFLHVYKIYAESKDYSNTVTTNIGVKMAMDNYFFANGSYPCPADLTLNSDDPDYGLAPATPCDAGTDIFVTGGLPFKDLKIPMAMSIDGWGNKFRYTVTRSLTNETTYAVNGGVLAVQGVDQDGVPFTYAPAPVTGNNAHYVIWSTGNDGAGGITAAGGLTPLACPNAGDQPLQNENCDADVNYYNPQFARSLAEGQPEYLDDVMIFATDAPTRIWVEQDNGTDIVTGLNIGIGTETPTEALDVAGNIYAEGGNIRTDRVCDGDTTATNCFEPDMIGGSGQDCGANGIRGIRDGEIVCATAVIAPAAAQDCEVIAGPGHFMIGINAAGDIICN